MSRRGKIVRRSLIALSLLGLLTCTCFWRDSYFFDLYPMLEAHCEADRYAAANGYRDGRPGEFVKQPDGVGGCEVQVVFRDPQERKVTLRLRRAWGFAGWEVTRLAAN